MIFDNNSRRGGFRGFGNAKADSSVAGCSNSAAKAEWSTFGVGSSSSATDAWCACVYGADPVLLQKCRNNNNRGSSTNVGLRAPPWTWLGRDARGLGGPLTAAVGAAGGQKGVKDRVTNLVPGFAPGAPSAPGPSSAGPTAAGPATTKGGAAQADWQIVAGVFIKVFGREHDESEQHVWNQRFAFLTQHASKKDAAWALEQDMKKLGPSGIPGQKQQNSGRSEAAAAPGSNGLVIGLGVVAIGSILFFAKK